MSFDLTWGEDGPVNHADHRAVGLRALDACRDAANEWVFRDVGLPRATIKDAYVVGTKIPATSPTSRRQSTSGWRRCGSMGRTSTGLGGDFDPDEFLRNMAGYVGMGAGVDYAVGMKPLPDGLSPARPGR